jgi:hypothetical protein
VGLLRRLRAHEGTFVPGWSVSRVWRLSLVICAAVFLARLLALRRVDLAGPLVLGPCCALLTGRWVRTAVTALVAFGLAVVLSLVATGGGTEQMAFVVAVGLVGPANTVAAGWLQRHLARQTI